VSERCLATATSVGLTARCIDGDVPKTGAGRSDFCRETVKRSAVIGVAAAVLEAAKIRVVHQADVAELGTFNDDEIVLVEVFALMYKFHGVSEKAFSAKSKR
jgi:hypothetical protein